MKVLRWIISLVLVVIIVGGLGYIGYSTFFMGNHNGNVPSTQNEQSNTSAPNIIASQNNEKLTRAISIMNQAIDIITIDPYSKATLPTDKDSMDKSMQSQDSASSINIYPNGNNTVNIKPDTSPDPKSSKSGSNKMEMAQDSKNYVYDQSKLQQLHSGIFSLAQGMASINILNDDLLVQSTIAEVNPPTVETFIIRFNTAMQNKNRLNNALSLLSSASTLINVNPYASPDGYPYNKDAMKQLHQGIYKLAQGLAMLNKINDDFTNQMSTSSLQAQGINTSNHTNMTPGTSGNISILSNLSITSVLNIILVILLIGLIIGVIGGIYKMLTNEKKKKLVLKDEVIEQS